MVSLAVLCVRGLTLIERWCRLYDLRLHDIDFALLYLTLCNRNTTG